MSSTQINVCVRMRPLSEREISAVGHANLGWKAGAKSLTQLDATTFAPIASQTYAFGESFLFERNECFFFHFFRQHIILFYLV